MDMSGEYRLTLPREAVWRALNDPDVLKESIPGCEEIVKESDTQFRASVTAAIGPVKAHFTGRVTLSDLDPPNGYKISGEGQGGVAGFAKGSADVRLIEDAGATLLRYTASANVGGKRAQIGSRLIDAASRKMADEFFGRFAEAAQAAALAAAPAPEALPPAPIPPGAGEAPAAPEHARPSVRPIVWVIGVIVAVVVLLLLFR